MKQLIEVTGTALAFTYHPRSDGSMVLSADILGDDGKTTTHVTFDLPAGPTAKFVEHLTYDARAHHPTPHLRVA